MERPIAFATLCLTAVVLAAGCACSRCESDSGGASAAAENASSESSERRAAEATQATLGPGSWTISSLPGADLTRVSTLPTLVIDEDGGASGTSGVNTFNATVETDAAGAIRFAELIYTEMAGSPEAMAVESAFFGALSSADGAAVRNGRLELTAEGETVAVFSADSGN